jgi:hypothetical protein
MQSLSLHLQFHRLQRSPEVTHYVVHNIMGVMLSTGLC